MSTEYDSLQKHYHAYQRLPNGSVRLDSIQSAVMEADQASDQYWRLQTRYDEMLEHLFHGDDGRLLPLVGEIVAIFEEQPLERFKDQYLYTLYVSVDQWGVLPQLPAEQWQVMMDYFWNAVQRYNKGHREYYERSCYRAFQIGREDLAAEAYGKWLHVSSDNICSCAGCKQFFKFYYAYNHNDMALCEKLARPILDGTLPCDQEPVPTLSFLLDLSLEIGTQEQCAHWAELLRPHLLDNGQWEFDDSMLRWLARSNPDEGIKMFEQNIADTLGVWSGNEKLEFYTSAWVLFALLTEKVTSVQLKLPKKFPLWRQDGGYETTVLADWFYRQALDIAQAFDNRDGFPYHKQSLDVALRRFE